LVLFSDNNLASGRNGLRTVPAEGKDKGKPQSQGRPITRKTILQPPRLINGVRGVVNML